MNGLCECGCGCPAPIAKRTCRRDGAVKGQPNRFINGHNRRTVFNQLVGQRFGMLLVLARDGTEHGRHLWNVRCDCGIEGVRRGDQLEAGTTQSCGCGNAIFHRTHGMTLTREYMSWHSARTRCLNPNDEHWSDYGGRGIKFLFTSFEQFFAELGPRPQGKTLDRINNDSNYEPGNVRWATAEEQNANRRSRKKAA